MRWAIAVLLTCVATTSLAQSPEDAAKRYFTALAESNKEELAAIVYGPSAERIGKSIIAAAPMFHRRGATEFFEMIFDRVPRPAEIAAMSPLQAFAEYMCDPLPDDRAEVTKREVLGVVYERDDLAHVVYRVEGTPNLSETSRDLLSCVQVGGEWRVVVSFRVWEAYSNHLLKPAMARLSDRNAESSPAQEPGVEPLPDDEPSKQPP